MHQGYDADLASAGAAVPRAIAAANIPDVMIVSRTRCLGACVRCHDNWEGRGCAGNLRKRRSQSPAISHKVTTANGMYAVQKIESKIILCAPLLLWKCEPQKRNAGPALFRFYKSCAIRSGPGCAFFCTGSWTQVSCAKEHARWPQHDKWASETPKPGIGGLTVGRR